MYVCMYVQIDRQIDRQTCICCTQKHGCVCTHMCINPTILIMAFIFVSLFYQTDGYDTTGCYNLLCSGFIQTSDTVAIGASIAPISSYGGSQYQIEIMIWKVNIAFCCIIANTNDIHIFIAYILLEKNIYTSITLKCFTITNLYITPIQHKY